MNNFKHIGIYVKDINSMSDFYKKSFNLKPVCENLEDTGELYEQLYGLQSTVLITKLITEYGTVTNQGEMIELIQVKEGTTSMGTNRHVQDFGLSHFSLGVDDIETTIKKVQSSGGKSITDILNVGSRKCCFCIDIEGNVIEVIQ